jgi:hypothetical protein
VYIYVYVRCKLLYKLYSYYYTGKAGESVLESSYTDVVVESKVEVAAAGSFQGRRIRILDNKRVLQYELAQAHRNLIRADRI